MAVAKPVTTQEWEQEVLQSSIPVLVDFWAAWCGPCRLIAPVVEQMAQEFEGKLKVLKLDVDHEQAIAMRYGIMSIPTLLLFKNGQVMEQIVGVLPQRTIIDQIKRHL